MLSVQMKSHFASEQNRPDKKGGQRDTRYRSGNKVVSFLRTGCQFFANWPLNSGAPKWKLVLSKILCWLHFTSELWSVLALINGLGCCFVTVSAFVKSIVELIFMLESSFNFIYYRLRATEFQRLIIEMEYFFETSDPRYTTELALASYILAIPFVTGALLFAFAPMLTENTLIPLNTVYFMIPNEKSWGRYVAYALNVFHILSASSVMFLDLLTISIMWYAGCKFALLSSKLNSLNEKKIRIWIGKHQRAISYAGKVNRVVAPLAVKSTVAVALYVVVSGLVIINVSASAFVDFPLPVFHVQRSRAPLVSESTARRPLEILHRYDLLHAEISGLQLGSRRDDGKGAEHRLGRLRLWMDRRVAERAQSRPDNYPEMPESNCDSRGWTSNRLVFDILRTSFLRDFYFLLDAKGSVAHISSLQNEPRILCNDILLASTLLTTNVQ